MNKAVIYARYSSDTQTEQSIEGQLRVCQQYAQNNDTIIVDTYIDRAMTGTNDLRPAFQKMIKDSSKRHWNMVLVYKLDRFSRDKYESTIHKRTLKDHGVKLVSAMENIPDTPEGIILESLLEGMNQYYSMELSQKVRRGLKESWMKGQYTGGYLLYGYDVVDKKCIVNKTETTIVQEIFAKYAEGFTAVAITADLKKRGVRNKTGGYFSVKQLYRMLSNSKYTGKVQYGGQIYDNIVPQIISNEVWHAVQQLHESNKHAPGRKKDIYDFVLSGKLVCGDCKRLMVGESGTSRRGTIHYYYSCLSRRRYNQHCELKPVPKQYLEDIVINTTWKMLSDNDTVRRIAENVYKIHESESKINYSLKMLETERNKALKASENLIKAIEAGIITEQTKIRLKELEAQISSLDFDIESEKQRCYTYLTIPMIESFLNSVIYGKVDCVEIRKAIVKMFIREVMLYDDKIIITYNFIDNYEVHKITKESSKQLEKQAGLLPPDSLSTSGLYKLTCPPPYVPNAK